MSSNFPRLLKQSMVRLCAPALIGIGAASISTHVAAVNDVLDTPAMQTQLAAEYLLTDIESVGGRLVAVGARGHIVYSDDRGDTWTQAQVPVSVLLTGVEFVTSEKGWAVGHGGVILHSNDGGVSWVKQFDGNAANTAIIEQAEAYVAKLEAELDSLDGEDEDLEYELEDAQYALEDAVIDAEVGPAKPFLDLLFLDEDSGFAVGAYGYLFATTDGGRTWSNIGDRLDNIDRFHLNTISQIPGGDILIAGEAGVLFQSSDLGGSWITLDSPYDGSFFGLIPLAEKGEALVFGLRGNIFRTEDSGRSWTQIESNTQSTLVSGAFDGNRKVSVTGNGGAVVLSEDGGKTFKAHAREDRLGQTALAYITRQRIALVGEAGVEVVTPAGESLF